MGCCGGSEEYQYPIQYLIDRLIKIKRREKDSIEASWLTFLHSDEAKHGGNNSLGACAWLYKLGFGLCII